MGAPVRSRLATIVASGYGADMEAYGGPVAVISRGRGPPVTVMLDSAGGASLLVMPIVGITQTGSNSLGGGIKIGEAGPAHFPRRDGPQNET